MEESIYLKLLSFRITDPLLRRLRRPVGHVEAPADTADLFQETLLRAFRAAEERWENSKAGVREDIGAALLRGSVVKLDPLTGKMRVDVLAEEERQAAERAEEILAEVASSLKRARKTQSEIKSLKKKTQAVLENLP